MSVLLHGTVIFLFARSAFAPPTDISMSSERPSIRVSVVPRLPPLPSVLPVPQTEEGLEAAEPVSDMPTPEPELVAEVQVAERPPADEDDLTDAVNPERGVEVVVWTAERVRAAVQGVASSQRSTATEAWIAGCILEQKARGTRDCDRQLQQQDYSGSGARTGRGAAEGAFAVTSRRWRTAQLTASLEKRKIRMQELMDESGPVGQLAAARFYTDLEIVRYLNGNASPYGPRNQFLCRVNPCVYEYTGFVVKRPEQEPDENEFRVVPIVLGNQR